MQTFKKRYAWVLNDRTGKVFNIEIPHKITVWMNCLGDSQEEVDIDRLKEFLDETLPKGISVSDCQWMVNDGCWNCIYLKGGE